MVDLYGRHGCEAVVKAAREYRRQIKVLAPTITVIVVNRELLKPIKEAAQALDVALAEYRE